MVNGPIIDKLSHVKKMAVYDMFASVNKELQTVLIGSNLVQEARSNPRIKTELDRIREQSKKCPGTYLELLADAHGNPPTIRQLRRMIDVMRRYLAGRDHQLAYQIDRIKFPRTIKANDPLRRADFSGYLKKNKDKRKDKLPCSVRKKLASCSLKLTVLMKMIRYHTFCPRWDMRTAA